MKKSWFLICLAFLATMLPFLSFSQTNDDVLSWKFESKKVSENVYDIIGTVTIVKHGFHVWGLNPGDEEGLIPTKLTVNKNSDYKLLGSLKVDGKLVSKVDEFMGKINYYENKVVYTQRIEAFKNTTVKGKAVFQTCNENGCLPPGEKSFEIKLTDVVEKKAAADTISTIDSTVTGAVNPIVDSTNGSRNDLSGEADTVNSSNTIAAPTKNSDHQATENEDGSLEKKSLIDLFLMGLGAGFVAFIMPCIYAMLPVTVSFFTKRSKDRATGIKNAIFYALSIIIIFAGIGALISIAFTEKTMYEISTSIWFNLFVFVIFIVFGISLLGAFEITLPSSWTNALDKKANTNSFGGIFFMALVLVIVSFSCTSAFISMLVVYIINSGNSLGGIVGFFGFGFAIALPFAAGALFPGMINKMAKSGGWLNAVKVTMGILELALSLKFLSNVDLQFHLGILDVEVFLAIWIVLFTILGLYLLGKIKFSHDEELPKNPFGQSYISVPRLLFAIASLSFAVYMVPGLFGAPLEAISGFMPERKTLDFNIHDRLIEIQTGGNKDENQKPVKYTDKLKSELPGVTAFFDYEEALATAKKTGKPVLLDFTGHSCINCRKMERAVLSKPEVLNELNKHFIVASLYVDDSYPLAQEDQYKSDHDGSLITTLGAKNLDLQLMKYKSVMQPLYVFVDAEGNLINNAGGYNPDVQRFMNIINEVKSKHQSNQK